MSITISDVTPRVQYTAANTQTTFAVGFEFFTNADLKVFAGNTQLTFAATPANAAQYSVAGAGVSGGGSITLGGASTNGVIYTIFRDMAVARSTDFPTSGAFQIGSLNTELDKIIAMIQQVERDLKFSPKAAATTANTFNLTFPNLVANKILSVNSSGTALEFGQSITDVATVAGIASDISALSAIASDIAAVENIKANITSVAGDATDIGAVAAKATEIGRLGTSDAVTDMNTLGTSAIVTDMNLLATSANVTAMGNLGTSANVTAMGLLGTSTVVTDLGILGTAAIVEDLAILGTDAIVADMAILSASTVVADMAILATSAIVADMAILGTNDVVADMAILATNDVVTDMNTLGTAAIVEDMGILGTSANVTAMGLLGTAAVVEDMGILGTSANVTAMANVSSNINSVNSFASKYRIGSSDPNSSLDEGDLAYNTQDNNLKFYNGSSWTSISPGIANVADDSTPQLGGNLDVQTNSIVTTSNRNVLLAPNGTGVVEVKGNTNGGTIKLNCESNSHGVKIKSPPHSAGQDYTLTLPSSINNGQFLTTNGSGVLSFAAVPLPVVPTVSNVSQTIAPASATTINIAGSNFSTIPSVEFIKSNTGAITSANTVSLTNGTTLAVNVTLASGSYYVRVELDSGNAGRSTNAIITASTAPVFQTNAGSIGTYAGGFSGTLFDIQGSSDSTVAFSEVTSVLSGAGISLNTSSGVLTTSDFGGSSTTATTYTFILRLTDQEAQTTDRQFTITSSFGATGSGQFN